MNFLAIDNREGGAGFLLMEVEDDFQVGLSSWASIFVSAAHSRV
jgi:hypothetical protein